MIRIFVVATTFLAACGGKAIIDPGGEGGAGSTTSSVGVGNPAGPNPTGPNPTGPPMNRCQALCSFIYTCGAMGSCPGFDGSDDQEDAFLFGPGECVSTCEGPTGNLFISLIDDEDCTATVDNLSGASEDFAVLCAEGL